jgi:hypothetical protein
MKGVATTAAAAGTGTWISVDGWPAAAAVCGAVVVIVVFLLWVLASDARTGRVLSIIAALRFQRR